MKRALPTSDPPSADESDDDDTSESVRASSPSIMNPDRPAPAAPPRRGTLEAAFGVPRVASVVYVGRNGPPRAPAPGKVCVIDLFCGIGGFSTGACAAGHTVALAVDCNRTLLECHAANHPGARHLLMELGPETEEALVEQIVAATPPGAAVHLHGSPPCTKLSAMQNLHNDFHECTRDDCSDVGMRLVTWYLRLVVRLRPASWSFEQVPVSEIFGALLMMKSLYPSLVDVWRRVDFQRFGVCQTRVRAIAGSPGLLRALAEVPPETPPSVGELLTPPPGATLLQTSCAKMPDAEHTVENDDGTCSNDTLRRGAFRSIERVCYTIMAGNPPRWAHANFKTILPLTIADVLRVQTFPADYKRPAEKRPARVGIGNAVPPRFAEVLMGLVGA